MLESPWRIVQAFLKSDYIGLTSRILSYRFSCIWLPLVKGLSSTLPLYRAQKEELQIRFLSFRKHASKQPPAEALPRSPLSQLCFGRHAPSWCYQGKECLRDCLDQALQVFENSADERGSGDLIACRPLRSPSSPQDLPSCRLLAFPASPVEVKPLVGCLKALPKVWCAAAARCRAAAWLMHCIQS